jgi:hypothetical protein
VVLNPAEVANADSLFSDLNWLRGRAKTLVSTLESSCLLQLPNFCPMSPLRVDPPLALHGRS